MIATPSNTVAIEPEAPAVPTQLPPQAGPASSLVAPAPSRLDASVPRSLDASPAASPPASPLDASMPRCLDPFSASLLESLAQGADPVILAASHSLSLSALALWLRDPHVKDTLDALRDLFALHHQIRQEQLTRDTLETLREVMTTSPDLAERRRSASAILRALTSPTTRSRRASEGPSPRATTPRNSDSPPPTPPPRPSDAASPTSSFTHSPNHPFTHSPNHPFTHSSASSADPMAAIARSLRAAEAAVKFEQEEEDANPLSAATLAKLDADKPCPIPDRFYKSPELLTERILDRLERLPNPTAHRAFLAIHFAIAIPFHKSPEARDTFEAKLEASPLCRLRPADGWTRTNHPVHTDGASASRSITWTHASAPTQRCTILLAQRGPTRVQPDHWWITDIITPDTS